jgi:hypothetical protein
MRSGWVWFAAAVSFLVLLQACGNEVRTGSALEVEELRLVLTPHGAKVLTGALYNPTARTVDNALIQVSLFDGENALLESVSIGISDVGSDQRKAFREPLDTDLNIQRARVKKVVAW